MRVTNRMMTTNMLNNINRNKRNMTAAGNQYSTGQKIQKPSEDPVIAVRSLKYRTQLNELEQFYEKNIPDALSWMDVTEGAMNSVNDILSKINTYCNQGSNDTLQVKDRNSILQTMQQYKQQIYAYANTDYAGRYVFTGYRTDTPMIFKEDITASTVPKYEYKITQKLAVKDMDTTSYVEQSSGTPELKEVKRIRLAYGDLGPLQKFSYTIGTTETTVNVTQKSINDTSPSPYSVTGPNEANFIPETGELILSDELYGKMLDANGISVTYDKSTFKAGEVKPEMYFECDLGGKHYDDPSTQNIEYEINFSQNLTVNTLGCRAISTNIGRGIDEIFAAINAVEKVETELTQGATTLTPAEKEKLTQELTLRKTIMRKKFASGITMSQKEQNTLNVALADHGSRYVRLELTESRLSDQKVSFTELLEKNDSVDIEDAVINYNSAQVVYNASLNSAARVVKSTLLDFL